MIARLVCSVTVALFVSSLLCAGDLESGEKDRYSVPEGDAATLLKFIEDLNSIRPTTSDEFKELRQRRPGAIKMAAERILQQESGKQSKAARMASAILLQHRIQQLPHDAELQAKTLEELKQHLAAATELSLDELHLALRFAGSLEQCGNCKLASEAYSSFGKSFSNQDDDQLAEFGNKMLGFARRLSLLGNELELAGTTLSGEEFDWSNYRGKVVLVRFWSTTCPPCIAELPNLKKHYDEYHQRGFEVVGISLDSNRQKLEAFIADEELPWTTLFQDGTGWNHPLATYYGVAAIPMLMLVNQEGRVVSLDASGSELSRQLDSLLGPPNRARLSSVRQP